MRTQELQNERDQLRSETRAAQVDSKVRRNTRQRNQSINWKEVYLSTPVLSQLISSPCLCTRKMYYTRLEHSHMAVGAAGKVSLWRLFVFLLCTFAFRLFFTALPNSVSLSSFLLCVLFSLWTPLLPSSSFRFLFCFIVSSGVLT